MLSQGVAGRRPRADAETGAISAAREEFAMTQLYLQRFEYRAATKSEFDQAWAVALHGAVDITVGRGVEFGRVGFERMRTELARHRQ
jgi:hypothetical protein